MKKIIALLVLLLALSPVAFALTLTDADIEHPIFPWGAYTLQVSRVTDDPAEIRYEPVPAQGTLAMLRLTSLGGPIALTDIEAGASQFELRDASGATCPMLTWLVTGVQFQDGVFSTNETQDAFDLIYLLPEGASAGGASLLIGEASASEHIIVRLPERGAQAQPGTATPEPAPELTPEPAPELTPEPASDQAAQAFLAQQLSSAAERVTDPWALAILNAGARDVTYQDGALSFSLRSFNPGFDALGDYKADKAAFLKGLWKNTGAYDLAYKLPVTNEGGFAASDADVKALVKTVSKAAAKSKKAFDNKKMRVAVSDYLLNGETAASLCGVSQETIAPLFAAQSKQSLSVSDGPFALKFITTGVTGASLLEGASQAVYQQFAKQEGANALDEGEIKRAFDAELAEKAASAGKKNAEPVTLTLNMDELEFDGGDGYSDFVSAYADAYDAQLDALTEKVSGLPAYPAQDFPKSGRLSGSKSGTKVIFKAPKDGYARLIQMRKVDADETAVTAFLQPGQSATVRVPKGKYYILLASGEIWYGSEHLFGEDGSYSRTEDLEIKGSNYYHTITLGGVTNGNMSSYDADPADFQ